MKKLLQSFLLAEVNSEEDVCASKISRPKQVVFLDFDGANTVYNGDLTTIGNVTVDESGFSADEIAFAVKTLNERYAGEVIFVSEAPIDGDYSTVFIGGTEAFSACGNFLGLAETIDTDNQIKNDNAFVITNADSTMDSVISVINHEVNHIVFGNSHEGEGIFAYAAITLTVASGQVVNDIVLGTNETYNRIDLSGTANRTIVNAGGTQNVNNGGISYNSVLSGTIGPTVRGEEIVFSGGKAYNTTINSGGRQRINASGWVSGTTVNSGGIINVNGASGTINNLTLKKGATLNFTTASNNNVTVTGTTRLGGLVDTTTGSGGTVKFSGATVIFDLSENSPGNTTGIIDNFSNVTFSTTAFQIDVNAVQTAGIYILANNVTAFGYSVSLFVNNVATGRTLSVGGSVLHGNVTYTLVRSTLNNDLYLQIERPAILLDAFKGGVLQASGVSSMNGITISSVSQYDKIIAGIGGALTDITVNSGGVIEARGGSVKDSFINTLGVLNVYSGEISNCEVNGSDEKPNVGQINIYSGATTTNNKIKGGGKETIFSGGTSTGAELTGTSDTLRAFVEVKEGRADGTKLFDYSRLNVEGGSVSNVTVNGSNAIINLSNNNKGGILDTATITRGNLDIYFNGSASGVSVGANGIINIYGGAVADSTISTGGWLIFSPESKWAGGTANNITLDGGHMSLSYGTATDTTVQNGSNLTVLAGGEAITTIVNAGGELYAKVGGKVTTATVNAGGRFGVWAGGVVKDVTLDQGLVSIYAGAQLQGVTRLAGTLTTYVPENNSADLIAKIDRLEFIKEGVNNVYIENVDQVRLEIGSYSYTDSSGDQYQVSMLINDNGNLAFNNQGFCTLKGTVLNSPAAESGHSGDFSLLNNGAFTSESTSQQTSDGKFSSFINTGNGTFSIINAESGTFTIDSLRNEADGSVTFKNVNQVTMNGRLIAVEGIALHTVAILNTGAGDISIVNGSVKIYIPFHEVSQNQGQHYGYIKDLSGYTVTEIRDADGNLTGTEYTRNNAESLITMTGGIHSAIGSSGDIIIDNAGIMHISSHGINSNGEIDLADKRASIVNFGRGNILVTNSNTLSSYGIRNDGAGSIKIDNTGTFTITARQLSSDLSEYNSFDWENAGFGTQDEWIGYLNKMKTYLANEYVGIANIGTSFAEVVIHNAEDKNISLDGSIVSVSNGDIIISNAGNIVIGNNISYNKAALYNDYGGGIDLGGLTDSATGETLMGNYTIYGGIVNNSVNGFINVGGMKFDLENGTITSQNYNKSTIYGDIINNGSGDVLLGLAAGSRVFSANIKNSATGRLIIDMKGDAAVYGNVTGGDVKVFGGVIYGTVFGTADGNGGSAVSLSNTSVDGIVGTLDSLSRGTNIGLTATTVRQSLFAGAVGGEKTIGDKVWINSRESNLLADVFVGNYDGGKVGEAAMRMVGGSAGGNIYGGGKNADVEANTNIYANGNVTLAFVSVDLSGKLYGAGDTVHVGGGVYIEISNSGVSGVIYGAGLNSTVDGSVTISITNEQLLKNDEIALATRAAGTVITGNIYGAGQQSTVKGNVNILIQPSTIRGDVYGGGSQSTVVGNVNITVTNSSVTGNIYGGGDKGDVNGDIVVNMGGTLSGNLSGGSNKGSVGGSITLDFSGEIVSAGGIISGAGNSASVGTSGNSGNAVTVSVNTEAFSQSYYITTGNHINAANSTGDTVIYGNVELNLIKNGMSEDDINGTLYGGSARDRVNGNSIITGQSTLNFGAVNLGGLIFGGGYAYAATGQNISAVTEGGVKMNLSGTVNAYAIYGGGRARGNTGSYAQVGTSQNLTGVGINVTSGSNISLLFGGAYSEGFAGALSVVYGDISIVVDSGVTFSVVYGGGRSLAGNSICYGQTSVSISGQDVNAGYVYAGGIAQLVGSDTVTLGTELILNDVNMFGMSVYGGGRATESGVSIVGANSNGSAVTGSIGSNIVFNGGTIGTIYGGGNAAGTGTAAVYGGSHITVTAGTIVSIFGGGYCQGTNYNAKVYGGSNILIDASGDTSITISTGVYGGGLGNGTVAGGSNIVFTGNGANLNMSGAYVSGDSGKAGSVSGVRSLTFDQFSGSIDATFVLLDSISIVNGSSVVWTAAQNNLSGVSNWNFDLQNGQTTLNWETGNNSFTGDVFNLNFDEGTFNLNDFATVLDGGASSVIAGWQQLSGVYFNGIAGSFVNGVWVDVTNQWQLSANASNDLIVSKIA